MDESVFWKLIAEIDREALREDDEETAVEPLVAALAKTSEAEIKAFEDILAQRLYDLDGPAWADGDSGQSGDGFLYVRCYVVAMGKKFYDSVQADPKKTPKDAWCESLLAITRQAWAALGNDEDAWDYQSPVNYETGSNKANWS